MLEFLLDFVKRLFSRKFLGAVALTYVAYNTAMMDGLVSEIELLSIMAPILAFIGVEGWADAMRAE